MADVQWDKTEWKWWRAKLRGEDVPIHTDQPMTGYYAMRRKKGERPEAVAFWYKGDELKCLIGKQPFERGLDMWLACARNPISQAVYEEVRDGGQWPEEIQVTLADGRVDSSMADNGKGHNSGDVDADFRVITGDIAEWMDRARKVKKQGVPKSQEDADAVADIATKLGDLRKEADSKRLEEGRPLREDLDAVNAKWSPYIGPAQDLERDMKTLVGSYINEQNRKAAEAARAAKEASGGNEQAPRARAGTRKTVSMVKTYSVGIDDHKKVLEYFAGMDALPPDILEAVKRKTLMLLKAGIKVPGATLKEQQVARG